MAGETAQASFWQRVLESPALTIPIGRPSPRWAFDFLE
jgi:hypothetical protein